MRRYPSRWGWGWGGWRQHQHSTSVPQASSKFSLWVWYIFSFRPQDNPMSKHFNYPTLQRERKWSTKMLNNLLKFTQLPSNRVGMMVDFIDQSDWAIGCPICDQTLFCVCVWGCFWRRLTFESVPSKESCPPMMGVGLSLSTEDLDRAKSPSKRKLLLSDCLSWDISSFSASGLKVKHWLFLGLKPTGFWTRTYIIGSPRSPAACWLQILRLLNFHNYVSQLLLI